VYIEGNGGENKKILFETYISLIPTCIYCQKTSKESGRAMFMIKAPGIYYQCYPELCLENKERKLPDGRKLNKNRFPH